MTELSGAFRSEEFVNATTTPSYYEQLLLMNLPFYNSTESLTLRVYDYTNLYMMPAICVFGIITSAINIFILAKTGINENIHLYMLIGSVSDLGFLLTQVFIGLMRCGVLCPYGYTYAVKVYELYIYLFLGYTIVTFSALVDISVSIDRIMLFSSHSKMVTRTRFAIRCVLLFISSALLILPDYVLARDIVPLGILVHPPAPGTDSPTYEILYAKSLRSVWLQTGFQIGLTVLSVIKGPALVIVVLLVDMMVIVKFNNHLKKKRQMTHGQSREEKKANRESNRATYMIISVSAVYFFGYSLDTFGVILELFGVDIYNNLPGYYITTNTLLFFSHGVYIFIYYNFDKEYNKLFQTLILRRKTLVKMIGTEATQSTVQTNKSIVSPS